MMEGIKEGAMESKSRAGIENLSDDLRLQRSLLGGRVPAYEKILATIESLLEEDAQLRGRMASALEGRTFFASYDRPLLILAALRFEALREGESHPLHRAIAAADANPEAVTRDTVAAALGAGRESVYELISSRFVQTNEPTRAVAWRWPAALAGCDNGARPLALVDIGASAGLNLVADALPAPWKDAEGNQLPVVENPRILVRLGLDANPLDPMDPESANWLRACIWPGDTARLERLEAALAAWKKQPALLERADVVDAPRRIADLLATLPAETLVLAYQTVVRDYLPPATARAYDDEMQALLASSPPGRLAFIQLESAPTPDPKLPAAIIAKLRGKDGIEELHLARCHWHPSAVVVDDSAAARFSALLTLAPAN